MRTRASQICLIRLELGLRAALALVVEERPSELSALSSSNVLRIGKFEACRTSSAIDPLGCRPQSFLYDRS